MPSLMPPLSMERFLTPGDAPVIADGFIRVRQDLTRGVPFEFPVEGDVTLLLQVPTGVAAIWRETDPARPVSASAEETLPHTAPRGTDAIERPALRLLLRRARQPLAVIPLAARVRRIIPDGNEAQSAIELIVVDWLLHAGCVRGPGDYGSFVEVAWRRADTARDQIVVPPFGAPRGGYLP
jgi:hypothetical protein